MGGAGDNAKALAKAGELGYLSPLAPVVQREVAKASGAKWLAWKKAWEVPKDKAQALAAMSEVGFTVLDK